MPTTFSSTNRIFTMDLDDAARAAYRTAFAPLSRAAYETAIEREIEQAIRWQEELGMDVLVHGESERNDMVQYFGEQLEGCAFMQHGWVQS